MQQFRAISLARPSSSQLKKLRRGQSVRVSAGEGLNLIVHGPRFNHLTRCFDQNKGAEISLAPQELSENADSSMGGGLYGGGGGGLYAGASGSSGRGIFGKKGDQVLKKIGIRDKAYKIGDIVKPGAKMAISAGLTAAAGAASTAVPWAAPAFAGAALLGSEVANRYLDKPGDFGVGHGLPPMNRAGLGLHLANAQAAVLARKTLPMLTRVSGSGSVGSGLAMGLGAGIRGRAGLRQHGRLATMNVGGNLLQRIPQALQSQPYAVNFMWSNTLPIDYQAFNCSVSAPSGGIGRGRGLYP